MQTKSSIATGHEHDGWGGEQLLPFYGGGRNNTHGTSMHADDSAAMLFRNKSHGLSSVCE